MSRQQRFLSAESIALIEPTAPHRAHCEEHDKVLYTSKHDARDAQVGAMKSRRIRVYECHEHPERYHVTKEDVRYQIAER